MENLIDIAIVIIIFAVLILLILLSTKLKSKREIDDERKLKESLADEFIIDPETGAKLTLEQAQSGHWVSHDNEFWTVSEAEIEKLYSEEEKEEQRALNILKESKDYLKHRFTEEDEIILESGKTLSKYDDWSYSNAFKMQFREGFILSTTVKWNDNQPGYYERSYSESQLMLWLVLDTDFGHYYFRRKTQAEKFFDMIKNDDDLKLEHYECFTFTKTNNIIKQLKILNHFKNERNLEIEFLNNNLFIKTTKPINKQDVLTLDRIAREL